MTILRTFVLFLFSAFIIPSLAQGKVTVGVDVLFDKKLDQKFLKDKNIGLITNQTALNRELRTTLEILYSHKEYHLKAIFAPEHGIDGRAYAGENVEHQTYHGIPIYSLHGKNRRPTSSMLKGLNVLVYDIQDIGARSYTFISTLFYCMEEAAKHHIKLIVLDRPNPINGVIVDGPLLEEKCRSFVGYANVPYCHGMTMGELAQLYNQEYGIKCDLEVVPMEGWKRSMTFKETGLHWVPTSPNIPQADTPLYYPATGILGELSIVNIGVGYTLPFKILGAPWIDAEQLAFQLNRQKLPGVNFQPFHYRPFFGKFEKEDCHGVLIHVLNPLTFLPVTTQYTLMGVIKNLYPQQFKTSLEESSSRKDMFNKVNGNEEVYKIISKDGFVIWKLREMCKFGREQFQAIRNKYLIYN